MLIFSVLPTGPPEQRCLAALITISLQKLYMPEEIDKVYLRIKLAVPSCVWSLETSTQRGYTNAESCPIPNI